MTRMAVAVSADVPGDSVAGQQLGDAEVEQLHAAVGRDEDVGGLQIPMQHKVVMGVLHAGTDGTEQLQAPRHIRLVLIAPDCRSVAPSAYSITK